MDFFAGDLDNQWTTMEIGNGIRISVIVFGNNCAQWTHEIKRTIIRSLDWDLFSLEDPLNLNRWNDIIADIRLKTELLALQTQVGLSVDNQKTWRIHLTAL